MNATRREKRSIPDSEKDEKYWEKRQRNNMAAKRSRENKRLVEMTTKKKASILERENSMLRREIEVLKKRFGLPLNKTFLSEQELEAIEIDWQRNHSNRLKQEPDQDEYNDTERKVPHPVSLIRNKNVSSCHKRNNGGMRFESENSDSGGSNFHDETNPNLPYYAMLLAASIPGYAEHSIQRAKSAGQIYTQPPFQYYLPYGVSPQSTAADIKTEQQNDSYSFAQNNLEEDRDLKMKLMKISAQVEEMKSKFEKNK